jgi:3-deoxy-D-manno-octulosonic-acid transferase
VNALWGAYRVLAPVLGSLAPAAGVFTSPAERVLWGERMGRLALPGGCDAWVHAASLGEAVAAAPLVRELVKRQPDARLQLTATTRSGRERLLELGHPAALAPLDTPQSVRRFFHGVRPERVFLIETELWPHWLMHARRDRIPVAVVSARLSERSVRRYLGLGSGLRALVESLAGVLCQSEEDQQRWLTLGSRPEHTSVVGNLKSDGLPTPAADRGLERARLGLDRDRPLLVLGNVRPGEPRPLVRAWASLPAALRARWQVVAVPRHPRALSQLQAEANTAGRANEAPRGPARREAAGGGLDAAGAWRWDARLGVLSDWYRAADVAFVGGSLAPYGGHNPLEPAACGAAVIMGPQDASQREAVRALDRAGGIWRVADPGALSSALEALLGHDELRASRAAAALRVAESERGSAARAVQRLGELSLWPIR